MPIDLNRDEFLSLPKKQREAVIFDNIQEIRTKMTYYQTCKDRTKTQIIIVALWLFILTVALGFRRFVPL